MSDIQLRKRSHIDICTHRDVTFKKSTLLEEVDLIHCALPELDTSYISLNTSVAGRAIAAPFIIGAMTGGTGDGNHFNAILAEVAETHRIALCLGSMRPALMDSAVVPEFDVKKLAPNVPVFTNIGANQLNAFDADHILELATRISDGLFVHLNAGMELIQPRGDTGFFGQVEALAALVDAAGPFPIVVKETGMGLSLRDGALLRQAGVRTVETAGAGGTSWIGVETERATGINRQVGKMLWDFGIPTAASIAWMHRCGFETIGSGGVYTALDAARAIRLGASAVAMARPWLLAYQQGKMDGLNALAEELMTGLRYVMVCTGAKTIVDLQQVDCIIGDRLMKYINHSAEMDL
ncbi:MAG: type 2 isopentenyl-diphosphate Delta-isomerase [Deltaproteobacteria bacterium]|nr:type 2 isopentenyl-diphosphate Delta-isomerase [Deltaproteobacteria bacterium]